MSRLRRFSFIFVLLIAIGIILLTVTLSFAVPSITWTPESLSVTIPAGGSQTILVSFTASEDIDAAEIRVVPELSPFVQTNPTSFENIVAGQVLNLDITVTSTAETPPQVVDGTIQIRNAGRPPRNFAKPLPVKVEVVWELFSNTDYDYSFQYPPHWMLSPQSSGGENLYESGSQEFLNTDEHYTPPTISTRILSKPQEASLMEFANSWRNGWYAGYENSLPLLINGRDAVLYSDLPDIAARQPPLATFIQLQEDIVLLILGRTDEQTFRAILETLSFE